MQVSFQKEARSLHARNTLPLPNPPSNACAKSSVVADTSSTTDTQAKTGAKAGQEEAVTASSDQQATANENSCTCSYEDEDSGGRTCLCSGCRSRCG
jgi:hypothetical protein